MAVTAGDLALEPHLLVGSRGPDGNDPRVRGVDPGDQGLGTAAGGVDERPEAWTLGHEERVLASCAERHDLPQPDGAAREQRRALRARKARLVHQRDSLPLGPVEILDQHGR